MKNFIYVSIVLVILTLPFTGCKKTDPPSPPPESIPTLTVTVTPDGDLPYGKEITISWTATNTNSITINGKYQISPSNGSFKLRLFRDTTFQIIARNVTQTAKVDKSIKVGDWTTSKLGLITHAPWYMTANKRYRDGVLLVSYTLSEVERTDRYEYSINGKFSVFRSGVRIGYMDWIFSPDENSLTHAPNTEGPSTYTIAHLSEKKFTLTRIVNFADGLPCLADVTLERN